MRISLVPLTLDLHIAALQQLYRALPAYWALYNFPAAPAGQAENDLHAAAETPGRSLMGMVHPLGADAAVGATSGAAGELIGLFDFRLHWPAPETISIGMVMVAELYQRRGVGRQSWQLLQPWLAATAGMKVARLGVEQFNPGALQFFQHLGFQLTGEANRIKVGDKFVRLLYMEQQI